MKGSNMKGSKMKLALHSSPYITKNGHCSMQYPDHVIVAGDNPLGPRGGRNGIWVDGKVIARYRYRDRDEAYERMNKLLKEGYQLA